MVAISLPCAVAVPIPRATVAVAVATLPVAGVCASALRPTVRGIAPRTIGIDAGPGARSLPRPRSPVVGGRVRLVGSAARRIGPAALQAADPGQRQDRAQHEPD